MNELTLKMRVASSRVREFTRSHYLLTIKLKVLYFLVISKIPYFQNKEARFHPRLQTKFWTKILKKLPVE